MDKHEANAPPHYEFENPPQYQPPQQQQPVTNTVVMTGTGYQPPVSYNFGPKGQTVHCQYCRTQVKTSTTTQATSRTHKNALCIFFLCGWICCCCLLPYCMSSCKNTNHSCPNCSTYLGTYAS